MVMPLKVNCTQIRELLRGRRRVWGMTALWSATNQLPMLFVEVVVAWSVVYPVVVVCFVVFVVVAVA